MEGTAWARARCEPTRSKLSRNIQHPALSQLFDGCHKAPDRFVATTMRHSLLALAALFEQAKSGALSAMAGVGGMDTAQVGVETRRPPPPLFLAGGRTGAPGCPPSLATRRGCTSPLMRPPGHL